ncbi:gluconeogenesis factor YvcK family protein [Thermotoga caldifontis]|uniref:gluconeogenesis factor YvcK family protein n=1 Tax=Thermotoga caldifontis TaxID=1508419 RepID=UPI000596E25D|nr:gluconeogenesis factor YvcK family protein [Thermotoga caldifontis]
MKVVAIGGGTGLSTILKGLKNKGIQLTAVVAVTDEGGSSGKIRQELNVPPPGDVRNNIIALAKSESLMSKLFSYRFTTNGTLSEHSVGNIILAALTMMTGSFAKAVRYASDILAIEGKVLPVCEELIRLVATYSDGSVVVGETEIAKKVDARIVSVHLDKKARALEEVIQEISEANAIVLGPGSLYTSVITNLLVEGVTEAVRSNERAKKIYIANIMTQPGETIGYSLEDHVLEVERYLGTELDHIIANRATPSQDVLESYAKQRSEPVLPRGPVDKRYHFYDLLKVTYDANDPRPKARHDPDKTARVVIDLLRGGP